MRIIAFIEAADVIKKILKHFGLWEVKPKPRPTANASPMDETFEKRSILFKIKEGENFNHRNILSILRIKI
jgi:peptide subunit release factor RF-3